MTSLELGPPSLSGLASRWRSLYRDDTWIDVIRNLQRHARRLTGADGSAVWLRLPPHGDWLRITWSRAHLPVAWLPAGSEPHATATRVLGPRRYTLDEVDAGYRQALEDSRMREVWQLPLVVPGSDGDAPCAIGLLGLAWRGVAPEQPPALDDLLPMIAYMLRLRLEDVFIDTTLEWFALQPTPTDAASWTHLLAAMREQFGAVDWLLLTATQHGPETYHWEWFAGHGQHAGLGKLLTTLLNVRFRRDNPIHRVMYEHGAQVIDDALATLRTDIPERRRVRQLMVDHGLRSLLALDLGMSGAGRHGVLVVCWPDRHGWLSSGLSIHPWEALQRVVGDRWRTAGAAANVLQDPLTGALNRRGIDELWRAGGPDGLLGIVDCDRFKSINDHYGHLVGDDVLKIFSDVLSTLCLHRDGWYGRWGGDEFVVYLPAKNDWARFCDEFQAGVAARCARYGWTVDVGISGGAAVWHGPRPDWETAFHRADQQLLAAKGLGGRQFLTAEIACGTSAQD